MKEEPICEVYKTGTKYWRLNDKLHREDGPAVEYVDGSKSWYINGVKYTETNFWTKLFKLGKISQDELFLELL